MARVPRLILLLVLFAVILAAALLAGCAAQMIDVSGPSVQCLVHGRVLVAVSHEGGEVREFVCAAVRLKREGRPS